MSGTTLPSLPHSLEAERAVLGGILVDNDRFEQAAAVLTGEMFFRVAHRRIWAALAALSARQSVLDLVTLREALERSGELEDVDGPAYLASLIDGVPRSTNVPHYAQIVCELHTRRALIQQAARLMEAAAHDDAEAGALLDAGVAGLMALSAQASPGDLVDGPRLASEAMAWLEDVQQRRGQGSVSGTTTGIRELDDMTDGLQPGDLIVLAARPSQGKSALALQLALAADGPCAFFSLEMSRAQLAARALATLGRVDGWAMRRGYLGREEQARVARAMDILAESGLSIDDTSAQTVPQIRAKARRWQVSRGGLRLVVVDYIQLLKPATKSGNREQDVAEMSRGLKALARDLQVPVLALAQLNRAVEQQRDREPTLANLRESGALEQDADAVWFLHRPDGQSVAVEGPAKIIIAKHRNGPVGAVEVTWAPSCTRFDSLLMGKAS